MSGAKLFSVPALDLVDRGLITRQQHAIPGKGMMNNGGEFSRPILTWSGGRRRERSQLASACILQARARRTLRPARQESISRRRCSMAHFLQRLGWPHVESLPPSHPRRLLLCRIFHPQTQHRWRHEPAARSGRGDAGESEEGGMGMEGSDHGVTLE
eukprot:763519-Hanusia_phi.AAC.1